MGADRPKIRWQTYAVAICWAALLVGTGVLLPHFIGLHHEIEMELPVTTRFVEAIPPPVWILLGLVVALGIVWKSRLLSRKASDLVDVTAAVAWLLAGMAIVIALFEPFIGPLMAPIQP